MFDIGWQELFIIVVVGIIVIGPKELPRAARAIAGFVRKARAMAHEFQDGVDDMIRHADMEDIKKHVTEAGDDFKGEIKNTLDPDGTVAKDFELTEFDDDDKDYAEETDEDLDALEPGEAARPPEPAGEPVKRSAEQGTDPEPVTQSGKNAETPKKE
jgi:sec-independent protein translocase protein TatB